MRIVLLLIFLSASYEEFHALNVPFLICHVPEY